MPNDPNELFAIVPVEGTKSPSDAIIVGNMSAVMECLPQTVARQEAEGRLARQEEDAAEVTRQQQEVRACAAQILGEGLTRLGERLDQFETRKAEHAAKLQRDTEEAEYQAVEDEISRLPDPDNPDVHSALQAGDDGELTTKPPVDTERHNPAHLEDAGEGDLPNELERGAPPPIGPFGAPPPRQPEFRSPAAISLNQE
jgi:hypothetical protein